MNRKDKEKLAIPEWFKLENYAPLKRFATPRPWLEQFALRIDLMAHWRKAIRENPDCQLYQWFGCNDENYPEDLLISILKNPLPAVDGFVEGYPYVDFPTVTLVRHCAEPVRPMTVLDLVEALMIVPLTIREKMVLFHPELMSSVPHSSNSTDSTRQQSPRAPQCDVSSLRRVPTAHPQHLLDLWLMVQMEGGIDSWMTQFIAQPHENDSATYYAVDASVPLKDAVRAFRKHHLKAQMNKRNSSRMDSSTFAKWCDDGILPYIDLKIYEAIEQFRQKALASITEEEMADAIYPTLRAAPPRSSTCVSDTTKPVAKDLQNPFSARFRLLLARAAEHSAQVSRGTRQS